MLRSKIFKFSLFVLAITTPVFGAQRSNQELQQLAKEAVSITYNAHKSKFDVAIAQDNEYFVSIGAYNSGGRVLRVVERVKTFAEVIINQSSVIANQLDVKDRSYFWVQVGAETNKVLSIYLKSQGSSDTTTLKTHIENQIKMKALFG